MRIQINHIEALSHVDGPGERAVLFVQGCTIHCQFCQSKQTWSPSGGRTENVADIARTLSILALLHGNVTISGGDPMFQPQALAELVDALRAGGVRHILVYTGYTWEQLLDASHPAYPFLKDILENIDVLVDGPYVRELDDDLITWRGSRNQRPIDVPESLARGTVVTLDWDSPRVVIDRAGNLSLPVGLASEFSTLGSIEPSRMCGEIRREISNKVIYENKN